MASSPGEYREAPDAPTVWDRLPTVLGPASVIDCSRLRARRAVLGRRDRAALENALMPRVAGLGGRRPSAGGPRPPRRARRGASAKETRSARPARVRAGEAISLYISNGDRPGSSPETGNHGALSSRKGADRSSRIGLWRLVKAHAKAAGTRRTSAHTPSAIASPRISWPGEPTSASPGDAPGHSSIATTQIYTRVESVASERSTPGSIPGANEREPRSSPTSDSTLASHPKFLGATGFLPSARRPLPHWQCQWHPTPIKPNTKSMQTSFRATGLRPFPPLRSRVGGVDWDRSPQPGLLSPPSIPPSQGGGIRRSSGWALPRVHGASGTRQNPTKTVVEQCDREPL